MAAIPAALRNLATWNFTTVAGQVEEQAIDLLAADVLQSISNIFNPIAQLALEYNRNWRAGAKEALLGEAKEDGRKSVKWAKRLLVGGIGIAPMALIAAYPTQFGWLGKVIEFIKSFSV